MLNLEGVSMFYGSRKALCDVSFTVNRGEIIGVVGPNGAGKTTLFKVIAGIIECYEGVVSFDGKPIIKLPSSEVGYLAETPFQFDFFTPIEMLLFEWTLRSLGNPKEEAFDILRVFGLESHMHKPIRQLSKGLKKRVALAAAFSGNPSIVILDEPLNSLDIQSVIVLKRLIQAAQARGAIILISSHVLDFFDGLTSRVVFLNNGSVFYTLSNDPRKSEELYAELFLSA